MEGTDFTKRYRAVVLNEALSTWSLVTLIFTGVVGVVSGIIFITTTSDTAGLLIVTSGALSMLSAWIFAYATTYLPRRKPSATLAEIIPSGTQKNIVDACTYHAILVLGKHLKGGIKTLLADDRLYQSFDYALNRINMQPQEMKQALTTQMDQSLSVDDLLVQTASFAKEEGKTQLVLSDVVATLLLQKHMSSWLRQHDLQEQDVKLLAWWQHEHDEQIKSERRWWGEKNILGFSGIGLSWASGYTPFVDTFARIPTGSAWDKAGIHEPQLGLLTNTLARNQQSNVLLIGQPGVGRIGLVKELMQRVRLGRAHPALNGKRIVYIHISQLISLGATSEAQLAAVSRALDEIERAGNIIAILDGLGSVLGDSGASQGISDVLAPFFSSSAVRVVAVMSTDDYQRYIHRNEELQHLFEVIEVPPLHEVDTLQLLATTVDDIERTYKVSVSYLVLREIVRTTATILPNIPFPEKAFDILEELFVEAQGQKRTSISQKDVHAIISRKTGVDFSRLEGQAAKNILHLDDIIHKRVVNQEAGVQAVSRAIVRARAHVRNRNRPIGSFLFLGPTGVGKTETAKALAEAYFGSDAYLQRLDMSEFQNTDAIERLIGSTNGTNGRLTSLVEQHPFSVILLDEFEKSSRSVQELFLPLFDEGYIVDAHGRRYSFLHSILIATSNAGAELVRNSIHKDGTLPQNFDQTLRNHILESNIFLPELLNRFDGVITFQPLTHGHVREIASRMLEGLNTRLDAEHGITIRVTEDLLTHLVERGYDAEFGARPMARLIQDTVEYWIAEQIVAGRIQAGQQISIPLATLQQA